jgi:hypothetical protein
MRPTTTSRATPTETKGRVMLIDQSKPNGVPRDKLWILASALADLKEFDHSVQLRLYTELRKHYFQLEHVETKISKAHYRVRFGDYRGTIYKDHDRYYLMRIFPKNLDQRSYVTSLTPKPEELMDARPLPGPIESELPNTEAAVAPRPSQNGDAAINGTKPGHPLADAARLPATVQEAMQKLQTVFIDLYREQAGMLDTVTEVNDLAARNQKTQSDDRARVVALNDSLVALKQTLRDLHTQYDQLASRMNQSTENFDNAIEIALGQIQTLDAKLTQLQTGLQERIDADGKTQSELKIHANTLGSIQDRIDVLATLSDWKRAYPELSDWLTRLDHRHAELQQQSAAELSNLRTNREQRELAFNQRCQALESAVVPRSELESHRVASQERIERLQSRIQQLEDRLARAERRTFWQWFTGG